VRQAQGGDDSAFEILIARYDRKITSHIYAMLRDYDRALDLAQETFLRLLTRVDYYKETARFSTWLYRIGTNLAIDEIRRRRRWRLVPIIGKGEEEWQPPRLQAADQRHSLPPDAPLLEDETRTLVRAAVATLPEHYRSALVLKDLQDMPYEEVAEVLEVPVGTVKSRVNRARSLLKESLREHFAADEERNDAFETQSTGKTV
jgi:RNA polymerase sigma-70 factor (ECF subfamily)